jgi:hypothetical protein
VIGRNSVKGGGCSCAVLYSGLMLEPPAPRSCAKRLVSCGVSGAGAGGGAWWGARGEPGGQGGDCSCTVGCCWSLKAPPGLRSGPGESHKGPDMCAHREEGGGV